MRKAINLRMNFPTAQPTPHPYPLPSRRERREEAGAVPSQTGAERDGRETSHAPHRRVEFLGCPLDLLTSVQLLEELRRAIEGRSGPRVIQFVNANKVAQVQELPDMGPIMWRSHYVLADGQPMLPLARMLGIRIPERIDGIGLMGKLLALADRHRYSIYLLGAKQPVVEACADRIRRDYPNLRIAGYRNGYFSPAEASQVVAQVRSAQPDILFLGMGSPMKERFADQYAAELDATVIQGVGGSFDVLAGLVKRAPVWLQRVGLEWLYRVLQEPKRMAWRYAKTNAICLWVFARAVMQRNFRGAVQGGGR
ncbi:MAG: WecB/TagA/CpsF family glycosyltransferase [candidate division KSB1 bacterium]|nr:WecB/TagA/CpsF family glycosyltransferase [candidate division KSB1 bacterium]